MAVDLFQKWFTDGKKQALGKKGTGWMKYQKGDFKGDINDDEARDEFARGWLETLQWEYEVGNKFPKIKEDDTEKYLEAESGWITGYSEGIKIVEEE